MMSLLILQIPLPDRVFADVDDKVVWDIDVYPRHYGIHILTGLLDHPASNQDPTTLMFEQVVLCQSPTDG